MKKFLYITVLCVIFFTHSAYINDTIIHKKPLTKLEIVKSIVAKFPEQPKIMVAIAIQESQLNPSAVSYNCYYKGYYTKGKGIIINKTPLTKSGKGIISWFCNKGDEKFAWSKDGSIFQINNPTNEDMTVDGNLDKAKDIYEKQGLKAWSSYRSGDYKKQLTDASKLIIQSKNI